MVDLSKMSVKDLEERLEILVRQYQSLGPGGLTPQLKEQIEQYSQAYYEKEKRYYRRPFVRYQFPLESQ